MRPSLSSLRGKLLLALMALQVSLFGSYSLLTSSTLREAATRNLEVNALQTAEIINLALTPYATGDRLDTIQDFLDELIRESNEGIVYLAVDDPHGKRLLSSGIEPSAALPEPSTSVAAAVDSGTYHYRQKILLSGNRIGVAQFGLSTRDIHALRSRLVHNTLLLGATILVLTTLVSLLVGVRFNRRLDAFMHNLGAIASGRYAEKLPVNGRDELCLLAENINRMSDAVEEREKTFSSVFNAAPIPMFLLRIEAESRGLVIDRSNAAAESMFGPSSPEPLGANSGPHLTTEAAARQRALTGVLGQAAQESAEIRILDKHGTERPCLLSGQHFGIRDRSYLIAAVVDITDLRQAETQLRALNADLENRVAERTRDLHASNTELAETVERLQKTREQLVQSEKLSSLGSIVAAVAHELNTPVGNAVTLATTQQALQREFRAATESGLTRAALKNYLENSDEAILLLVRNLARAAELIQSFKDVAVDRTSSKRRAFDLRTVIDEIVHTLQPALKHGPVRIEKDLQPDIGCDSYPGPLGQIITNLISNAAQHAFEGRDSGTVRISASRTAPDSVRITVCDDGCGIPEEHVGRVFDPFFTTRLGQGGSGLGLNIVYNLVTGLLAGKIAVESTLGRGTCFTIDIPTIAPHNDSQFDHD